MKPMYSRSLALCAAVLVLATACSGGSKAPVRTARPQRATTASPAPTTTLSDVYAAIGPTNFTDAVRGITPRVFVPNSQSDSVDVIDPKTYKVTDHFRVGKLPQHITPSWDMKHLYVGSNIGNALTEIDPRTGKKGRAFAVDDPYNVYFTPDGSKAIVVAERNRRLDFYNAQTWEKLKSLEILHLGPNHLDFTIDGKYLLISCEFSGFIVKVDVDKMEGVKALNIGGKPTDVRISPDGSVFYVANETRNGVSVVDIDKMKELDFIKAGAGTHGFVVSRDGKSLYVTNRNAGTVSVLDFATRKIAKTWYTGGSPDMGGVTPDGNELWLSARYHASVLVIDTATGQVKHRIPVGSGPHGVCVWPQPGRFSLGHTGNYR